MAKLSAPFASWHAMLPPRSMSSAVRLAMSTFATVMRVVLIGGASCVKLTLPVIVTSQWLLSLGFGGFGTAPQPAVVSIERSQVPTIGTSTCIGVGVLSRARIVKPSREAPCAGTSSIRAVSLVARLRSTLMPPNDTTPGAGPDPKPLIKAAGSLVIAVRPVLLTRTWTALVCRSAEGNPPGVGSMPHPAPQPPPPKLVTQ